MDINNPAAAYLDNFRLTAPSNTVTGSVNRRSDAVNHAGDFAGTLENLKKAAAPVQDRSGGPRSVVIDKSDKLYEQCLELETFLVKTLVSTMRNTVQKSGLVEQGFAGKMYEDMLYDEYAKDFTRNAGFGMAEQVYLELTGQRGKVLIRS